MSDEDYTRFSQLNVGQLAKLGAWDLVRYIERSSHVKRQMILQLLGAQKMQNKIVVPA